MLMLTVCVCVHMCVLQVHSADRVEQLSRYMAVNQAFAICTITKMINAAVSDYRSNICPAAATDNNHANSTERRIWHVTDLAPDALAMTDKWQNLNAI